MSTTTPPLILYPLYPGGPQIQGGQSSLSANSAFYIPATAFNPSYAVNIPSTIPSSTLLTLGTNQILLGQSLSSIQNFDAALSFNGSTLGGLVASAIPSDPTSLINQLPSALQSALALDSISSTEFSTLLTQPSFEIPWSNGLGLLITTDGHGGISSVQLAIEPEGLSPNPSQDSPYFLEPDRVAITTGAIFKTDMGADPDDTPITTNPTQNPLPKATDIPPLSTSAVQSLPGSGKGVNNSSLSLLSSPLSQDNVIAVSGYNATLTSAQILALAANQSGFGVNPSEAFQQNIAALASSANTNNSNASGSSVPGSSQSPQSSDANILSSNSASQASSIPMDQLMMGRLPMLGTQGIPSWTNNPFAETSESLLSMGGMGMGNTSQQSSGYTFMPSSGGSAGEPGSGSSGGSSQQKPPQISRGSLKQSA